MKLAYEFSSQTVAPPTSSQLRLDAPAPYSAATQLWVRFIGSDGFDAYHVWMHTDIGARLIVQDGNDHTRYVLLVVTGAPEDRTDHIRVPVRYDGGSGALNNNQQIAIAELDDASETTPPQIPPPGEATAFLDAPWASPQSVSSVLLVPPAEEPLTLAQAKLRANLDWADGDPRDDLMRGFLAAARQQVEQDTGLALIRQTRLVTLTVPATGPLPLPSQALPLLAVADADGTPLPVRVRPPLFSRVPTTVGAPLVFDRVQNTLTLPAGVAALRIEAGWPDAATFAREAPLLHHAVGLLVAHYATLGRDLASVETAVSVPMGYDAAVHPFRLMWVT